MFNDWECTCRCHSQPVLHDHACCDTCLRCSRRVKADTVSYDAHANDCMRDFAFKDHTPQEIADAYDALPGYGAGLFAGIIWINPPLLITGVLNDDDNT